MNPVTAGDIQRFIMGFDLQFPAYIGCSKNMVIIGMYLTAVNLQNGFGEAVQGRTIRFQVY